MTNKIKCVVVGGAGALGKNLIKTLRAHDCTIISVDMVGNPDANICVLLNQPVSNPKVLQECSDKVRTHGPFDAIICVAGGWKGGSAASADFFESVTEMYERNIIGATLAASIAISLKEGGLAVFTSAKASLGSTSSMIGYGMAKSATNHLVSSLAAPKSGAPKDSHVVAILPETLDTEANRKNMPNADFSSWTKLDTISNKLHEWLIHTASRPANGSLITIVTRDGDTTFTIA